MTVPLTRALDCLAADYPDGYEHLVVDMLQRQHRTNLAMAGRKWDRRLDLPWARYLRVELYELIGHHNSFKHWKPPAPDLPQARMELVDVVFFALSYELTEKHYAGLPARLAEIARSLTHWEPRLSDVNEICEQIVEASFQGRIAWGLILRLMDALGLTFQQLYVLYLAKSALNALRDDHGQQQGRYLKSWFGREDNVVMQERVLDNPTLVQTALNAADPAARIRQALEPLYAQVLAEAGR